MLSVLFLYAKGMSYMLLRQCNICGKVHRQGEPCHYSKNRQKVYDREHRNKERSGFYHSKEWKAIQAMVKAACHGLDMYEYIYEHRITKGRLVHHIVPLEEDSTRALDLTNLIYVSDKTHKKIHDEYKKGDENKIKIQKILFSCNQKFLKGAGGI